MVAAAKEARSGSSAWPSTGGCFPKLIRAKQLIAEGGDRPRRCWRGKRITTAGWRAKNAPGCVTRLSQAADPSSTRIRHRIDAFNFLFGKARARNRFSALQCRTSLGGGGFLATVLVEYAGGVRGIGVRGIVDVRWNSRIVRDQFRVIGTDGELNLDPLLNEHQL